jgi:hypothetical protein
MENFMDIFNDDAFSLISLTAAINNVDHVPGRAGELAFAGTSRGVAVTTVAIESRSEALSLIQTSGRGTPAPKETRTKANVRSVSIPHIKLEDTIQASEVQGVRTFGTSNQLSGVQEVVNGSLTKMARRHDLTLEHHRLGALRGEIKDADGSALTNLFTLFGITNDNSAVGGTSSDASAKIFDFDFDGLTTEERNVRLVCQDIKRWITRKAKMVVPSTARVWAFCGDNFFDKLIEVEDVKATFNNTAEQRVRLGANYAFGVFDYGDVVFENYRGTDDDSGTVGIDPDEAIFFLVGVPGLYEEYYAPATFVETVNTLGLPRYAKLAPDNRFNESIEAHTQQNPLPLCMRPQTLLKGVVGV